MTTARTSGASSVDPAGPLARGQSVIADLQRATWQYSALRALVVTGCPEQLRDGPLAVPVLADRCGADAEVLRRLLRSVAQTGLLASVPPDSYRLTAAGRALVEGQSVAALTFYADQEIHAALGDLPATLKTGKAPFMSRYGSAYGYLAVNPSAAAAFDQFMTASNQDLAAEVAANEALPATGTVADVGGGKGTFLAAALRARPGLRGILLDLARVADSAKLYLAESGIQERCEIVAGDFFTAVPSADAYILAHVIHLWEDERAVAILRAIRTASPPHGRVLIVEHLLAPGDGPSAGKDLDIRLLALGPGRERSREEYGALLTAAGFRPGPVLELGFGHGLFTAELDNP
jgi:hypothetical protein